MKVNNDLAHSIIVELLKQELIPSNVLFDIEEKHITSYIKLYSIYKSNNLENNTKTIFNFRLARKLAALTLIKLKLDRGAKANQCKEGFVYTISNPAWPNHLKLGMSVDVKKRLSNYQTYSPYRDYKLTNYEFVFNRRETEKSVLNEFNLSLEAGEWFKDVQALDVMSKIRNNIPTEPFW